MDNLFISYLLNGTTGTPKGQITQGKAGQPDSSEKNIDFLSLLSGKMCEEQFSVMHFFGGTSTSENDILQDLSTTDKTLVSGASQTISHTDDNGTDDSSSQEQVLCATLQALLNNLLLSNDQTCVETADSLDINPDTEKDVKAVEDFLKGMLEMLQDGESIQLDAPGEQRNVLASIIHLIHENSATQSGSVTETDSSFPVSAEMLQGTDGTDESEHIRRISDLPDNPEQINQGLIVSYLASIINQSAQSQTGSKSGNAIEITDVIENNISDKTAADKTDANLSRHSTSHFMNTNRGVSAKLDNAVPVSDLDAVEEDKIDVSAVKIEIKKTEGKEGFFQILSNTVTPTGGEEEKKEISLLMLKSEKTTASSDEATPVATIKITDKEKATSAGSDKEERQMLPHNDYTKSSHHGDAQTVKSSDKNTFGVMMSERIEKITEQFSSKGASMDMVVRLKIDDKETLLVGLKDQGQRIAVEVKTTNETMGNFLQNQKDVIIKQLEGKQIYTNIHVDINNEQQQKKEQKGNRKNTAEVQENEDFVGFLESMA